MKDSIKELMEQMIDNKKKQEFRITIKQNSTGDILVDEETNCIIGSYDMGEQYAVLLLSHCSPRDRMSVAFGAMKAANDAIAPVANTEKTNENELN